MTVRELLEQANLAALGLLDPEEHQSYERALMAAPLSVRDQVKAEQARWAEGGVLLPDVQPPEALRERVLESVQAAMLSSELQSSKDLDEATGRRRVSPVWRIGAMGMLSAAAVMTAAFVFTFRTNQLMDQNFRENRMLTDAMAALGGDFIRALYDPSMKRVILSSEDEAFAGQVALFVDERTGNAMVFAANLAANPTDAYHLVVLDEHDVFVKDIQTLDEGKQSKRYDVSEIRAGMRIAIVTCRKGESPTSASPVLASAVV